MSVDNIPPVILVARLSAVGDIVAPDPVARLSRPSIANMVSKSDSQQTLEWDKKRNADAGWLSDANLV